MEINNLQDVGRLLQEVYSEIQELKTVSYEKFDSVQEAMGSLEEMCDQRFSHLDNSVQRLTSKVYKLTPIKSQSTLGAPRNIGLSRRLQDSQHLSNSYNRIDVTSNESQSQDEESDDFRTIDVTQNTPQYSERAVNGGVSSKSQLSKQGLLPEENTSFRQKDTRDPNIHKLKILQGSSTNIIGADSVLARPSNETSEKEQKRKADKMNQLPQDAGNLNQGARQKMNQLPQDTKNLNQGARQKMNQLPQDTKNLNQGAPLKMNQIPQDTGPLNQGTRPKMNQIPSSSIVNGEDTNATSSQANKQVTSSENNQSSLSESLERGPVVDPSKYKRTATSPVVDNRIIFHHGSNAIIETGPDVPSSETSNEGEARGAIEEASSAPEGKSTQIEQQTLVSQHQQKRETEDENVNANKQDNSFQNNFSQLESKTTLQPTAEANDRNAPVVTMNTKVQQQDEVMKQNTQSESKPEQNYSLSSSHSTLPTAVVPGIQSVPVQEVQASEAGADTAPKTGAIQETLDSGFDSQEPSSVLKPSRSVGDEEKSEDNGPTPREKQFLEELTITEAQRAAECTDPKSAGADTIICVDTSDSMAGEGIAQAKQFIEYFLEGIEELAVENAMEENIALVSFGKKTQVLQHLTNDYGTIRELAENLETGGPSPIMTGLVLCVSAIYVRGGAITLHNHKILPRILLLSDGKVTDPRIMEGNDGVQPQGMTTPEAKKNLLDFAERLKAEKRYVTCIPCGEDSTRDDDLLQQLAENTGGSMADQTNVRMMSRNFFLQTLVAQVIHDEKVGSGKVEDNTEAIQEVIQQIGKESPGITEEEKEEVKKMVIEELKRNPKAGAKTTEQLSMLPVGARVRRGVNWMWEDQDGNTAGTVTSVKTRQGMVHVEWDCNLSGKYRYGAEGAYDLREVDEPRYLPPGTMALVGVQCKRGPDWDWGNQDGGPGSIGTVFKIEDNGIIHVSWKNGKRGNYRFGLNNKFDILMCDGTESSPASEQLPKEPSPKEHEMKVVWQWQDQSSDQWIDHSEEAIRRIEELFKKRGKGTTLVTCNGESYRVVIQNYIQRNVATNAENPVRRIEVPVT